MARAQEQAAGASCGGDPATAAHAAAIEQWVFECCRVELDEKGNVATQLPALMAAAVSSLVEAAAIQDAAAHPNPPRREPTRLHGYRAPGISIHDYAGRLLCYCNSSPVCYVAAFAYMLRLQAGCGGVRGGAVRVDSLTAHRMMAVGTIIAAKFYDDKFFSNHHYAQVAGVGLAEWNVMELDMLFRLGFRARVGDAELFAALKEMQALAGSCMAAMLPAGPVLLPVDCSMGQTALAEGEASFADTTTTAAIAAALAVATALDASCESEELQARAVSAPPEPALLPWAAAVAAANGNDGEEAAECLAPPRRSKTQCSMEHPHLLASRQMNEERQHLADTICHA